MTNILKKHSSNPSFIPSNGQQSYRVTPKQSRLSQINNNQNLYTARKQRYFPNYYFDLNNEQKVQKDQSNKYAMKNKQFQIYRYQNTSKNYEDCIQYSNYPSFIKQNITQVKNIQNEVRNSVKPKLSRNVYLSRQNPQQKRNYILSSPRNLNNISSQSNSISTSIVQYQHFKKSMDYQINSYQPLPYTNLSRIRQKQENKLYNKDYELNNQQPQNLQFQNNSLQGFTFKDKQMKDSSILNKDKQTKHQSKVSSQQQYGLKYISSFNKTIPPQSPRQSQKSSHLFFQLKSSINQSTSDSRQVIPSILQTKTSKLIKQYERQNKLIQTQNNKIENSIQQKIIFQRQLLIKMNKLMKLFENLKNQEISKIKNSQNFETHFQSKQSQIEIHSLCSNKNRQIPKSQSQISLNEKRDSHLSTKASFENTNNQQKSLIKNQNYHHYNIEENQIQSPKKLRINVVNDTILEYSPIDQSVLSLKKPVLYNFNSGSTLKDQIFENGKKDKNDSPIKSKRNLIDVSMSGFESRFVPRQNNESKLKELQEIFQKQLERCYSPKEQTQKSVRQSYNNDRKEKKQKLRRLSEQIKQLRIDVEKQNSTQNIQMLIFSNSSLT